MTAVNIIVPIYNQPDLVEQCIDSVLSANVKTKFRLTLIDDASPDLKIKKLLGRFKLDARVRSFRNESNLGFTRTANWGLANSEEAHPLLLNSDTVVYDHWLDVLVSGLETSGRVASINPLTNQNGSRISCYPRPLWSEDVCREMSDRDLAALAFDVARNLTCPVPTCVGFCMLINRDCLIELGHLDQVNFPRGYGEESDFCYRARYMGWTHLVAGGAFVTHLHGKSFGKEKNSLMADLMPRFEKLHPSQKSTDANFQARDPLLSLRCQLDLGRTKRRLHGRSSMVATQDKEYRGDGAPYILIDLHGPVRATLWDPETGTGYPNVAPYMLPGDVIGMMRDLAVAGVRRIEFPDNSELVRRCFDQAKRLVSPTADCRFETGGLVFKGF